MKNEFYAHSKEGKPPEEWHKLEDHLRGVAELARNFANEFGAGDWGYLAGLWHDLGKYSEEFQERIRKLADPDAHIEGMPGKPDHSTAGAKHAVCRLKDKGKLLGYAIAGHHTGIPDGETNDLSCLSRRVKKKIPDHSAAPPDILNHNLPLYLPFPLDNKRGYFQLSFFTRMLFSSLVDADFLDTERFIEREKSAYRNGYPTLMVLERRLMEHLDHLVTNSPKTVVNQWRAYILQHCLIAADLKPGIFSLTVPTGGGKTLSSLAFALKHGNKYGHKRIIYVIPYTSIIEQNADVFRQILGEQAVLEHHSNFEPDEEDSWSRLASENWDAPLIVTTNVQFFESIFSHRSSRCRKIHNIARSVVILDEAQKLPIPFLKPILEAIKELASPTYGVTVVLCTATQPALSKSTEFKEGLEGVREIIPNPVELYHHLKKVDLSYISTVSDDELARQIVDNKQSLCIVNTRKHARKIYQLIHTYEGAFHLSGLMCPIHRTTVLQKVYKTLREKRPCRLVSTQLVEAGVDIDFPVVFRSLAGIDSIAQAAGRCNREGILQSNGKVWIFLPEDGLPPRYFRQTAEITEEVLRHHRDPLDLKAIEDYFRNLFWLKGDKLDEFQILTDLSEGIRNGNFPFRRIGERFKIIREEMESIIIPWNEEADKMINDLRINQYSPLIARKVQRYTIQVYRPILLNLISAGAIERIRDQFNVLINRDIYKDDLGLCPDDPTFHEIENLIT